MKKKALALLLAAAMAIQPLSVAGAAEFTDGQSVDVEPVEEDLEPGAEDAVDVFTDEVLEEPVVEEKKAEVSETLREPTADDIQIGDKVWVTFSNGGQIATIWGEGPTWDYLDDGSARPDINVKNPFVGKEFAKVKIEQGITYIGRHLFSIHCDDMETEEVATIEKIEIANTVNSIGSQAFMNVKGLKELEIPSSVKRIESSAFELIRTLEKITLNDGLEEIGNSAFAATSIKSIFLPDTVSTLGRGVFLSCNNLKEVHGFDHIEVIPEALFEECPIEHYNFENVKEIRADAFYRSGIKTLNFSEKLEKIQDNAFCKCNGLTSILLPNSVTEIKYNAFRECKYLKSIKLSESLKVIDDHAFFGCPSLEEIVIPQSVMTIEEGAFSQCLRLNKVTFLGDTEFSWNGPEDFNQDPFENCIINEIEGYSNTCAEQYAKDKGIKFTSLGTLPTQIKVGDNITATIEGDTVTLTGSGATYDYWDDSWYYVDGKKEITCIKIGNGITGIGDNFFGGFSSVSQIKWPETDSIRKIGNNAFQDCQSLPQVILPDGLVQLGENAFCNCQNLNKIVFPASLQSIPRLSLEYDGSELQNLTEIEFKTDIKDGIKKGVKYITENAFNGSSKLDGVTIPDTIISVGEYAFSATGLTKISLPNKEIEWGDGVFADTNFKNFEWKKEYGDIIPNKMFHYCRRLEDINIAEGVVGIGESAFEFCNKLDGVIIPESMKYFNDRAFKDCSEMKTILIPKLVNFLGINVFQNCRNLTIKGYKDSVAERYALANAIPFVSIDYKVIFKEDGRTIGKPQYIPKNGNATPPTLTPRPGYTLSWDADYTNITEDMVINAVWTKDGVDKPEPPIIVYPPSETKYTVTFKDRGKVIKTEKVVSGEAADFPYISRYGYELSWDKDFSKVTSNMTVNAVWTVIKPAKVTSLTGEALPKYARLSWDRNEYTDYYLVYRKAAADEEFKQVAKTTRVLWNDKKVKPGNEYQYKVVAVGSVEGKKYQGEYSDTVTVKIGKPETGDIYSVGKLNYKIMNSNEVRVIGLAKNIASLSIPTAVSISGKPYKVTSIDHKAFYRNENLVDVKIGNNVNYIGKYSFYQCPNLETVKFGGRVQTISTCAFTQCPKLGNVVLPSSVERLGAKAFFKCTSMRIMTVKTSRLNYLGTKALAINPKVTIRLPKAKYSSYVRMIKKSGRYAATKFHKF